MRWTRKLAGAAMPGVLNLTNVLQMVVDRLDQRVFAQHQLLLHQHQPALHVLPQRRDEFAALTHQPLESRFAATPAVLNQIHIPGIFL